MNKYYVGPKGRTNKYDCTGYDHAVYYDSEYTIVLYSIHNTMEESVDMCDLMNQEHELLKRKGGI